MDNSWNEEAEGKNKVKGKLSVEALLEGYCDWGKEQGENEETNFGSGHFLVATSVAVYANSMSV